METTITEFLSKEYKEYSFYTIENRAIPSVIDGLKPVHRKIIHVANEIWKTGGEKTLKGSCHNCACHCTIKNSTIPPTV